MNGTIVQEYGSRQLFLHTASEKGIFVSLKKEGLTLDFGTDHPGPPHELQDRVSITINRQQARRLVRDMPLRLVLQGLLLRIFPIP
jgi:hypothetical protein